MSTGMVRVFELAEKSGTEDRVVLACIALFQAWGEREVQILNYFGFGSRGGQRESLRPKLIKFLKSDQFKNLSPEIDRAIAEILSKIKQVPSCAEECTLQTEKWLSPSERKPETEDGSDE